MAALKLAHLFLVKEPVNVDLGLHEDFNTYSATEISQQWGRDPDTLNIYNILF